MSDLLAVPRSLAERTEAMFRSVDPSGGIAQEWKEVLERAQNAGVKPATKAAGQHPREACESLARADGPAPAATVLVPREPTEAMLRARYAAFDGNFWNAYDIYRAMLSAALSIADAQDTGPTKAQAGPGTTPASSVTLTEVQIENIREHYRGEPASKFAEGIEVQDVRRLCALALAGLRAKNKESKDG